MALGTITPISVRGRKIEYVKGSKRAHLHTIQLTSGANYVQGGTSITAAQVGLKNIEYANPLGLAAATAGATAYAVSFKRQTDGSVKMYVYASGAALSGALGEVAAATDLSTFTVDVEFVATHRA